MKFQKDDFLKAIENAEGDTFSLIIGHIYKVMDTHQNDGQELVLVSYRGNTMNTVWWRSNRFVLHRRKNHWK